MLLLLIISNISDYKLQELGSGQGGVQDLQIIIWFSDWLFKKI